MCCVVSMRQVDAFIVPSNAVPLRIPPWTFGRATPPPAARRGP